MPKRLHLGNLMKAKISCQLYDLTIRQTVLDLSTNTYRKDKTVTIKEKVNALLTVSNKNEENHITDHAPLLTFH